VSQISKKLQEVLKRRGQTTRHLAEGVGLSVRVIYNLACGNHTSRRSRQKITNWIGEQIWPGVTVSGRLIRFPSGTEIECETAERAIECAREFGSSVTVKGKSVCFALPTRVVVQFSREIEAAETSPPKNSASRPQTNK
jgi:transcriptional regulator with XRE-family HTH domain